MDRDVPWGYRVGKFFCLLHKGGDCGAEARDWLVFVELDFWISRGKGG
jgi:hypothetical protein